MVDIRQTEIHTAEQHVPGPSAIEVELAIKKLNSYKPPGIDQFPAEMIKAEGRKFRYWKHKLLISV